jgi:hypothetical protein
MKLLLRYCTIFSFGERMIWNCCSGTILFFSCREAKDETAAQVLYFFFHVEKRKIWNCCSGKFLVPDWGIYSDSVIGLSYRPASLCSLASRYASPMPESTMSPSQGLRICYRRARIDSKASIPPIRFLAP